MRLNRDTGPPAKIHDEIFLVLAVFLDGLEIIVTGAESNDAQTYPGGPSASGLLAVDGWGSAMSRESWKLFALAVPVT